MSSHTESIDHIIEPINLKHRITGAAVLIFFGILVLPWLLGPPSEAQKETTSKSLDTAEERHSTFEQEVLSTLQASNQGFDEPEETVYVSKITPVDGGGLAVASTPVKVSESEAPSRIESESSDNAASALAATEANKETGGQSDGVKREKSDDSALQGVDRTKAAVDTVNSVGESGSTASESNLENQQPTQAKDQIDVGWVVQVELLTDKKGAARLVDQLSDKGFEPQTTIVDTNRGPKTGTRIWLGPFAQRAQAGAENDRLEAKMGKRGFVRVYP